MASHDPAESHRESTSIDLGQPALSSHRGESEKIALLQENLNSTIDITRQALDKAIKRDDKLDNFREDIGRDFLCMCVNIVCELN